jgi:bacteriocin biosynthesis cyclodehydratase domain-containing protein
MEDGGRVVEFEGRSVPRFLPRLLPLLDGRRTAAKVVDEFPPEFEPVVRLLLTELVQNDVVLRVPEWVPDNEKALGSFAVLAASSPRSTGAEEGRRRPEVVVVGDTSLAQRITAEIEAASLVEVRRGTAADISVTSENTSLVVLVESPDAPDFSSKWNLIALEQALPWIQVIPFDGIRWLVGPIFVPYETCCHKCFELRRALNLAYEPTHGTRLRGPMIAPAAEAVVAGTVAAFALRWGCGIDFALAGVAHTISMGRGLEVERHFVLRVPRCPACSGVGTRVPLNPWQPRH